MAIEHASARIPDIGMALSFFTLAILFMTLLFRRGTNFIAAWSSLVKELQSPETVKGRQWLRYLHQRAAHGVNTDRDNWGALYGEMKADGKAFLIEENDSEKTAEQQLEEFARRAYDQFDMAGIMVLHSGIPNFLYTFVVEYMDQIVCCWEQGTWILKGRVKEPWDRARGPTDWTRRELYQCFSYLYVMAKYMQGLGIRLYPRPWWRSGAPLMWLQRQYFYREAERIRVNLTKEARKEWLADNDNVAVRQVTRT